VAEERNPSGSCAARDAARPLGIAHPSSESHPVEFTLDAEVKPKALRRKARQPVPWPDVLARPQYERLRQHSGFMAAWDEWVAWTETAGSKATTPRDRQAAAMLNAALRMGPE